MERPDQPADSSRLFRVRRSCLAVPASSERFISKARGLPADEVFLDLEDAVAPAAKAQARANAAAAVAGDWGGRVLAVRVNDATTQWAHRDVIEVVSAAARLDTIVLPKATSAEHVVWLDLLLGQVEREAGLPPGQTGIEAQIEDAGGLAAVNAIAAASPRLEALVFGPADFMASVGIRSLDVGGKPAGYAGGDAYHYALMRILIAARARGCKPSTGPTSRSATSTASGGRRPARPPSATTENGCCTRTRSTRPTRCSRRRRPTSRAPPGSSRRTRTPPASTRAARSCSATR